MWSNTIYSSNDARRIAKRRLPGLIFDYIDGAAGDGSGESYGRKRISDIRLMPRILNNVEHRNLGIDLFGRKTQLPFGISPMGMCNLAAHNADQLLAQMAAKYKTPVGVSTVASTSLEKMINWADGNAWFQLYFGGDDTVPNRLIDRAHVAGYETLVLTVDVPEVGHRPRELRRGFTMPFKMGLSQFVDFALHPRWSLTSLAYGKPQLGNFGGEFGEFERTSSRASVSWDTLRTVRDRWNGRLVVKGVLNSEDALKLKAEGVDAIQVSSHGGRQMQGSPAPIDMLCKIREAVGDDFPLFYDSGIRSGEDVIKAYAMGANFVFLGRTMTMAIAANGQKGLDQIVTLFEKEASITLAQLGKTDINQIDRSVLA